MALCERYLNKNSNEYAPLMRRYLELFFRINESLRDTSSLTLNILTGAYIFIVKKTMIIIRRSTSKKADSPKKVPISAPIPII